MSNAVSKAEAATEQILVRHIMERKLQGYQHEIAREIVAAVIEKLDWCEDDQKARRDDDHLKTEGGCDGS